jgi:hypothetical protein
MKRAMAYLVKLGVVCGLVLFAVACASAPAAKNSDSGGSVYPAKIQDWIETNQDDYIFGAGSSPIDGDEQFAIQDAGTIAFADLTRNIENRVAAVSENITKKTPQGTGSTREQSTRQRAAETISNARTVGPVRQDGKIYVLKYVERNAVDKAMEEGFEISRDELNEMLDGLK